MADFGETSPSPAGTAEPPLSERHAAKDSRPIGSTLASGSARAEAASLILGPNALSVALSMGWPDAAWIDSNVLAASTRAAMSISGAYADCWEAQNPAHITAADTAPNAPAFHLGADASLASTAILSIMTPP